MSKTTLDTALGYMERGWAVIPIPHGQKGPAAKDWQKLRITADDAAEYFTEPNGNVGLLLGEPSGGIVDADLDCVEAMQLAKYFLPKTGCVFGRKSRPQSHFLYQCKVPRTIKYQTSGEQGGTILELRSNGGQTVLPGSTHPSGEEVRFAQDEGVGSPPPDALKQGAGYLAAASLLLRNWESGIKDDLATALAGVLLRSDWEPERVNKFIGIISTEAGDKDTQAKLKAERLHDQLKSKQGHVPGLPSLKKLIGDQSADRVVEWLGLNLPSEVQPFPTSLVMGIDDFVARDIPPRDWIIEGVLTTQALMMVYGWRGCGKTWLSLSMAVAIASGEAFLNWDCSSKHRVLYIDGEMPAADLQQRAKQMRGHRKEVLLDLLSSEDFYQSEHHGFLLNSREHQQRLLKLLEALEGEGRRPAVLFFDNLSSMSSGVDENDNSAMDSLLAFFMELRHLGYTVVIIHHAGKGGQQRGASRREDLLDTVIKLGEPGTPSRDGNAKFKLAFEKNRGGRQPQPVECELIAGKDGFPVWAMREVGGVGEKPVWLQILQFIVDNRPETTRALAGDMGKKENAISKHLKRLRDKGYLETKGLMPTKTGISYLKEYEDAPDF